MERIIYSWAKRNLDFVKIASKSLPWNGVSRTTLSTSREAVRIRVGPNTILYDITDLLVRICEKY
jgi:hypothetical protein